MPAPGQPGPGHPHRERQQAAQVDDPPGRGGLGDHPVHAEDPAQQRHRLVRIEHAEVYQADAFQDAEAGPAGHQHRAARAARQQRPDLAFADRVVEHHQNPPSVQPHAVQGGAFGQPIRDDAAVHAQGPQQPVEHLGRIGWLPAHAAQVQVQLPVRELPLDLVGDVHRQRGLAHPALAGHRRNHDGWRRAVIRGPRPAGQEPAQDLDLFVPAGEVRRRRRELRQPARGFRCGRGDARF